MRRTQGKKHKLGTHEINKISLSCFDDKIFSQMIINKKKFKKILAKKETLTGKKDSKRFS